MGDVGTAILSTLITSGVFLGIGGWIVRMLVERKVSAIMKRAEIQFTAVVHKRVEIATEIFLHAKRAFGGGGTLGDLGNPRYEIQVACWFPDEVHEGFRNFVAKLLADPSGASMHWASDLEPFLQLLVRSVRPDSRIIEREGINLKGNLYHFLPNISFTEGSDAQQGNPADCGQPPAWRPSVHNGSSPTLD